MEEKLSGYLSNNGFEIYAKAPEFTIYSNDTDTYVIGRASVLKIPRPYHRSACDTHILRFTDFESRMLRKTAHMSGGPIYNDGIHIFKNMEYRGSFQAGPCRGEFYTTPSPRNTIQRSQWGTRK